MACNTAMMLRSESPNTIAVERTPILTSSSRSTIAYIVSYTVTHSTFDSNNSHATRGTCSNCASNAMGIPQPKVTPKYICGTGRKRLTKG